MSQPELTHEQAVRMVNELCAEKGQLHAEVSRLREEVATMERIAEERRNRAKDAEAMAQEQIGRVHQYMDDADRANAERDRLREEVARANTRAFKLGLDVERLTWDRDGFKLAAESFSEELDAERERSGRLEAALRDLLKWSGPCDRHEMAARDRALALLTPPATTKTPEEP